MDGARTVVRGDRVTANEDLVREFVAAYSDGRLGDALALVTEDYSCQDVADPGGAVVRGREAFGQILQTTRAALPDVREELIDIVSAEERVAFRIRARGHHTGMVWQGRQATGVPVEWQCIGIWFVRDGRLSGEVYLDDESAIQRALAAEPPVDASNPSRP